MPHDESMIELHNNLIDESVQYVLPKLWPIGTSIRPAGFRAIGCMHGASHFLLIHITQDKVSVAIIVGERMKLLTDCRF